MKKWIVIVAFSALSTAIISLWKVDLTTNQQVIYIAGGEPVLADLVNQSDQFVFFEADGKSGMFMKGDVTAVGSIEVEKKTALLTIIERNKRRFMADMQIDGKTMQMADSRLLIFLALMAMSFAAMKVFLIGYTAAKNRQSRLIRAMASAPAVEKISDFAQAGEESSDLRDIALFFLELYKLQKGIDKDAPARFSMEAASATRKTKVFDLGVKGKNDWLTRRMSVGPLGEDTGSKSKCFYVIYDTHMVVKIPPTPVTDMTKYVGTIRKEGQIAAQLSPIACIVPKISVVLDKIKKLPFESSLTPDQREKQYIRMVEDAPDYQEYLKIGDCFAFFMELSSSFFLGRVIDELHAAKANITDEIHNRPDLVWDQGAFTTRFGLSSLPVFEGLQILYRSCEAEAKRLIVESGQGDTIHSFQIKNWFLAAVSGEKLSAVENRVDEVLLKRIEDGFAAVFKSNPHQLDELIRLLKRQAESKAFSKSRQQIENIATNMLQLLSRLKEKQIALRDLKPDNLFLDADPDKYPVILNDRTAFSIGVIDVETAVSWSPTQDGSIAQPLLGGTPLYATPLHLLKNKTITSYFGNLADVLHLQDWFATIAIIFKIITGRQLFPRAARSFPAIVKILKSGRSKSNPDEATIKAMCQMFWVAAARDIKRNLSAHADILHQLTLTVPEAMVPSIKAELEREMACIQQAIRRHVMMSPLVTEDKNRNFLLEGSSDIIAKQVVRWEKTTHLPDRHRHAAPQMVVFLNSLNRLKRGHAQKKKAKVDFAAPPHHICAHSLLEAMFQITFRTMYKARWKAPAAATEPAAPQTSTMDDNAMVTAILNDN